MPFTNGPCWLSATFEKKPTNYEDAQANCRDFWAEYPTEYPTENRTQTSFVGTQLDSPYPGKILTQLGALCLGQISTQLHFSPKHTYPLSKIGDILACGYEREGEIHYLQWAIYLAERALDATPCGDPIRPERLSKLGNYLGRRYEHNGAMEDLERAILQCEKALESTLPNDGREAGRLSSLGNWVAKKYERTGNFTDLENAVHLADEALSITPCDNLDRATYFNKLGRMLACKYLHRGDRADIFQAILFVKRALELTPQNSLQRAHVLSNLATITFCKFQYTRSPVDLDYAVDRASETLVSIPTGHPYRGFALIVHGDLLYCRYNQPQATEEQKKRDRNDCMSCYQQAWNNHRSPLSVRVRAAQKAAEIKLMLGNWEESNALLRDAVRLIPKISPPDLNQQDRQYILREFTGLATLAASAALGAGEEPIRALQLLEQGRAVGAGQQLGIRTAIAALKLCQPGATEKLQHLSTFLRSSNQAPHSIRPSTENNTMIQSERMCQRFEVAPSIDTVANEIRNIPGLETFLLPPTANEFQAAASSGPIVVINVSPFRCDAILIQKDSIRSLPLLRLEYKVMRQMVGVLKAACALNTPFCMQNEILEMLEWLWDEVASPILNELGFREPPQENAAWPRVWWIPTGLLSLLPIHAAGRHRSAGSETVIDRVISSYSPSVRSLLYIRWQIVEYGRVRGEACIASMTATPGCSSLPTAGEEIAAVKELLPALGVGSIRPLHNPRKEEVIEGLKRCNIFHFAGHGVSNPVDPSKSCLLLDDWKENPLTVESIMGLNLNGNTPFLAYLSACGTGANAAERLHGESINLMTACQLAGARHTVGSLWKLFNKYPAIAATRFYQELGNSKAIDDDAVAGAVHAIARHIREITRGPEGANLGAGDLLAWAAYIHIGP